MTLNWKTVKVEHVTRACESMLQEGTKRNAAKGIFVLFNGERLPAKHVVRLAYCMANSLPLDAKLKFSSGDGTVNLLQKLGFGVERLGESAPVA